MTSNTKGKTRAGLVLRVLLLHKPPVNVVVELDLGKFAERLLGVVDDMLERAVVAVVPAICRGVRAVVYGLERLVAHSGRRSRPCRRILSVLR